MSAFQLRRPALTLPRAMAIARPELIALLVLAAALNLWGLDRNGFANEYYAAAVRSMSSSWHAFLYGSFDAAGVMTVDKPPLASWVQVGFVKVFGYSSWSLLMPQALMGVASVALVYDLVRRPFGRAAGTVAGLVLALTPIAVAVSRHNNPDALLVLCSVAAVWFCVRALEDGRTRWLVLSGVAVGLGFETKMAVALMVVPGIVAAYLWIAPRGMKAALGQVAAFTGAAVLVGGAWTFLLALTPAASRPWVSGTADNSIWSLIFGYNGLGRLVGQSGGPGGMGGGPGGGGGGGGSVFGGPAGATRLVESSLGGQAGWLLGAALVGGAAVVLATRLRRSDVRSGWIILVGGAFLTCAVAFSTAKGIFHPYYVSLLAPFTAALVGALVPHVTGGDTRARVLACLGVAAAVTTELMVLHNLPGELTWLRPVLFVGAAGVVAMLAVGLPARARRVVLVAALGLVLVAPATWATQTLGHAASGTFPAGGPAVRGRHGRWARRRRASGRWRAPRRRPRLRYASRRWRHVRRQQPVAHPGRGLRPRARRRHGGHRQPAGRIGADHRLQRERGGHRRLLRPREPGQREVAGRGGSRGPRALGAGRPAGHGRRPPGRPRGLEPGDERGGRHLQAGVVGVRPVRLLRQRGRGRGRELGASPHDAVPLTGVTAPREPSWSRSGA